MQKLKRWLRYVLQNHKILQKAYALASRIKYKITHYREEREKRKDYTKTVIEATQKIEEYQNKDYIVFYNPEWLGVANSTKGLFQNNIPLKQVFGKKNCHRVVRAIVKGNNKTVIFSQIVEGWITIIKELKERKPFLKIKVIWHGNCYEFFSDYTWNLNKEVLNLCQKRKIDGIGFVRSTMYEFYKKLGIPVYYLQNNVHIQGKKETEKQQDEMEKDTLRVGIYNADSRELKNLYTALSAIALLPKAKADVVPINQGAKEFAQILNLSIESIDHYIETSELMKRVKKNTINLYPTYTENAPMFPLESFELGVICLVGNNNDYFIGTPLEPYVVLKKEDDAVAIKNQVLYCLAHKEEIMTLYQEWKKEFDKKCEKWVQQFIGE